MLISEGKQKINLISNEDHGRVLIYVVKSHVGDKLLWRSSCLQKLICSFNCMMLRGVKP